MTQDLSTFHPELHTIVRNIDAAEKGQITPEEAAGRAMRCLAFVYQEPQAREVKYGKFLNHADGLLADAKDVDVLKDARGDIKQVLGELHRTEPCTEDVAQ